MDQNDAMTPYEVYCHHCKVTFALGTKQCLHCGGRLSRKGQAPAMPRMRQGTAASLPPEIVVADEETSGRSRLPISPVTLLWIVLIAGTFAQRACQGG